MGSLADLMEYRQKYGRQIVSTNLLLKFCNDVYGQKPIDIWKKGCILPFPKKGDLGKAENYRGIPLTSIASKIYNLMLLSRIQPWMEKILRRSQNGFTRPISHCSKPQKDPGKSRYLPKTSAILLFVDFSIAFNSIHREKMRQIKNGWSWNRFLINTDRPTNEVFFWTTR